MIHHLARAMAVRDNLAAPAPVQQSLFGPACLAVAMSPGTHHARQPPARAAPVCIETPMTVAAP